MSGGTATPGISLWDETVVWVQILIGSGESGADLGRAAVETPSTTGVGPGFGGRNARGRPPFCSGGKPLTYVDSFDSESVSLRSDYAYVPRVPPTPTYRV
jgi:hypothetical protein